MLLKGCFCSPFFGGIMQDYKLIACDMDETALTSDLRLTERTINAMEKAVSAGKHVVFTTGRSYRLTKPYIDMVRGMRYALIGTGATGLDLTEGKTLFRHDIDEETIKWILAASAGYDILPLIFIRNDVLCPSWIAERAEEFHVGKYAESYRRYLDPVENPFPVFMENPQPVEKILLLFTNSMEKEMIYGEIQNLPVSFTSVSDYSLEINANGVSKARGLKLLCSHLGISLSECIAVGDAQNDMELIRNAGLGLAVANSKKALLDIADQVVPSNDEDGVAVAIEQYLL